MPMLHSEELGVILDAISFMERWSDPATVAVACRNKTLIQRYGRYPQRNAALGRVSTQEELTFELSEVTSRHGDWAYRRRHHPQ